MSKRYLLLQIAERRSVTAGLISLAVLLIAGCGQLVSGGKPAPNLRQLTVLYTNDEHGWMEGTETGLGAASLLRLWREREGFQPDGAFLVLSGGDNWTGPAVSTWVGGQSMVEVMNAMHYSASAVGNHEFDFGLEVLATRLQEADFPYLSANTRWRDSGLGPVELGILPYTVKQVNGLTVGLIGLTTTSTPRTSNPRHVAPLRFTDYEQALRSTVPLLEGENPDLLMVIAHVCMAELEPLALRVQDLAIDLMGGGHCNELTARRVGDTVLLGGGYHFTAYARARFQVDLSGGRVVAVDYTVADNEPGIGDTAVDAIVARWQGLFRESLGQVLAWSEEPIDFRDEILRQAMIDSWLRWDPGADIAISNAGGLRTALPAGQITLNNLVNLMPFENSIVALQLTGSAVRNALTYGGRPLVAGLLRRQGDWVFSGSGESLRDDRSYRVLVNSFMYDGGDNYQILRQADPDGYDTGIHYRQPFVEYLASLQTSPESPLTRTRLAGNAESATTATP